MADAASVGTDARSTDAMLVVRMLAASATVQHIETKQGVHAQYKIVSERFQSMGEQTRHAPCIQCKTFRFDVG